MAKKKTDSRQDAPSRRRRRGTDQMIADLEAKIAAIKAREARKRAKSDPFLRYTTAAVKTIDKAASATRDPEAKRVLGETRSRLAAFLAQHAPVRESGRVVRSAIEIEDLGEALLSYVRSNPGQRGEQIAAALAADTKAIRPVMKKLIAAGKVRTEGQRRGMTYTAT
jgi:hypothetical protein